MIPIELDGSIALVTGGSRGIGAAVVALLARAGASVVFSYRNDDSAAENVRTANPSFSSRIVPVKSDAASLKACQELVARTVVTFGVPDILVLNAGVWKEAPIGSMTEQQLDETLDLNLKGTFLLVNEVVPLMRKKRSGRIVAIASTAGQRGEVRYSHYAASKGGMIAMVKSLAAELGPDGIHVNAVSPGWVDTDMTADVLHDPAQMEPILMQIPLRKIATPTEIAHAVLFLVSPLSTHITGASVNVNGGSVLF